MTRRKVYSSFIDNIWGVDLADMQSISKFDKGISFLLCVIDIFSKYEWAIPLKNKKSITINNAFQTMFDKSNLKRNKIWVDKGSEFYNRSRKSWLEKNGMEITSISKIVYINKWVDIVNKYNNKYHSTIKMNPFDVKSSTYIHSSQEVSDRGPKFKIGDIIRI